MTVPAIQYKKTVLQYTIEGRNAHPLLGHSLGSITELIEQISYRLTITTLHFDLIVRKIILLYSRKNNMGLLFFYYLGTVMT